MLLDFWGRFFSYWQGRFAACALVGGFLEIERPKNNWGVAPNPTRGAASGLRKGQTKRDEVPPLTLRAIGLSALPYFTRVLIRQAFLRLASLTQ